MSLALDYFLMVDFVRYREAAPGVGEILTIGRTSLGAVNEYRKQGELILLVDEEPTFERHYVDTAAQKVRERVPSPVTLEGFTLRNLPPGAVVAIDGLEYPAEGEASAELAFDMPGTYRVDVKAPAHLTASFEVEWP